MTISNNFKSGRHFLQIPGPTNIPDRVLRAMDYPIIDHRGSKFANLTKSILDRIKMVFKTKEPVVIYSASGTGAWEAAIVNTLSEGDKVLMFETGHFSFLWLEIAKKLDGIVDSDYVGVIIAHGTDTMHYSSAFLSFALSGFKKPITLVGSQRSSDRPSSDAALNLISATKFLVNTKSKGVFVVMHQNESDDAVACHLGTRVRKNHTSKRSCLLYTSPSPRDA